jgi:hypothetical protein
VVAVVAAEAEAAAIKEVSCGVIVSGKIRLGRWRERMENF